MKEVSGDLFEYPANAIVIPINWRTNRQGHAIMGAGVAKQAALRWSWLPRHLGRHITCERDRVRVFLDRSAKHPSIGGPDIIGLPTKHDWRDPSDVKLIDDGVPVLVDAANSYGWQTVALPRLGCGLGQLDWEVQVRPLLAALLDDRFVVVNR